MAFSLSKSLFARMTASTQTVVTDCDESSYSHVMNKDLYKQRDKIVDDEHLKDKEPFPLLTGENIEYIGCLYDDHIVAVSNYRLFATGPNGFYSVPLGLIEGLEVQASKDSMAVVCKDARIFRLFFSSISKCRAWYDRLLECKRRTHKDARTMFAFIYRAYRKDEKLNKMWSVSGEEGIPLTEVARFGDSCEGGENGGEVQAPLLSLQSDPSTWREEVMTSEYRRMGLCPVQNGNGNRMWRITQCNDKYNVCPTYPKLLLVPSLISDEELMLAAKFRMSGRLPVISWRHQTNGCVLVRSSQPLVGVLGWRNPEDEKLLLSFSQSCALSMNQQSSNDVIQNGNPTTSYAASNGVSNGGVVSLLRNESDEFFSDSEEEGLTEDDIRGLPELKVFDLRSYTAALGNRAKGGGCECTDYYPNCDISYKGLPNIHTVRKSFQQLRNVLNSDDQSNYLSNLEGTQWLSYLCQLLTVACEIVGVVNNSHTPHPVLVHCSDGWDRTTQIITLAELMLDPYYRTIKGFRVLIEREWVGFGHRFSDRCGHTSEDMNQRSPIFLQWLDCVYQLLRQCPCDFQFNENFLVKLGEHCYSCLYGTFLYSSMKEREEERVTEDTSPVWALLHEGNTDLVNYLYKNGSTNRVVTPVTQMKYMLLWKEMYSTPLLTPYHIGQSTLPNAPAENSPPSQPVHIERSDSSLSQPTPLQSYDTPQNNSNSDNNSSETKPEMNGTSNSKPVSEPEELSNSVQATELVNGTLSEQTPPREVVPIDLRMSPSQRSETPDIATAPSSPPTAANSEQLSVDQTSSLDDADQLFFSLDKTRQDVCSASHESLHGLTQLEARKDESNDLNGGNGIVSNGHVTDGGETDQSDGSSSKQVQFEISPKSEECLSANGISPIVSKKNGIKQDTNTSIPNNTDLDSELIQDAPTVGSSYAGQDKGHMLSMKEAITLRLGVDGLPLTSSEVQKRLKELVVEPQKEIQRLRSHLREVQLLVHKQRVEGGGVASVEGESGEGAVSIEDQITSALEDQSPTSLSSWDCVDREEGGGVRWVPDHAVTHCHGCGHEFWAGLRKHHCRSCGGVFCGGCSNFYCPVPHEQLFQGARVCEKCFYKLDGHLLVKDPKRVSPT